MYSIGNCLRAPMRRLLALSVFCRHTRYSQLLCASWLCHARDAPNITAYALQHTYIYLFWRIEIAPQRMHCYIKACCSKGIDNGASLGVYEVLAILAEAQPCKQGVGIQFRLHSTGNCSSASFPVGHWAPHQP